MLGYRGRRKHRERGAALVEFALVMPIFLLVTGGVVDYGLAYRVKQSVESASRNAARVGAAASDDQYIQYADLLMLRSLYESLSSDSDTRDLITGDLTDDNTSNLEIVIFEPAADGSPKEGCLSGSRLTNSRCNIYTLADLRDSLRYFDSAGKPITTAGDANNYLGSTLYTSKANCANVCYQPAQRNVGQFDTSGNRLYSQLGVYVKVNRQEFFGNFLPTNSGEVPARSTFAMEYGATSRPFVPEPVDPSTTTTTTTLPTTTTIATTTTTTRAATTTTTRSGGGATTTTRSGGGGGTTTTRRSGGGGTTTTTRAGGGGGSITTTTRAGGGATTTTRPTTTTTRPPTTTIATTTTTTRPRLGGGSGGA
jgi:hypothetical protein